MFVFRQYSGHNPVVSRLRAGMVERLRAVHDKVGAAALFRIIGHLFVARPRESARISAEIQSLRGRKSAGYPQLSARVIYVTIPAELAGPRHRLLAMPNMPP